MSTISLNIKAIPYQLCGGISTHSRSNRLNKMKCLLIDECGDELSWFRVYTVGRIGIVIKPRALKKDTSLKYEVEPALN